LLGPRKCGKTYALNQINSDLDNTELLNFKTLSDDDSMKAINAIVDAILTGTEKTYLIDEATYMFFPEEEIAKIAESYTTAKQRGIDIKTKVVFTGSQSIALEAWGRRAFCNQARFLKTDFLSYPEWLRYKGREDVTAQSYLDFIQGTSEFYHFTTIEDYLEGCLDETIVSNSRARNFIYGNDCDLVDVMTLKDIMYLSLFTLHENPKTQSFFKNRNLTDKMAYLSGQIMKNNPVCKQEIAQRVANSFLGKYDNVRATDLDTLKQSFAFLLRCGLFTATPVFKDFEQDNINILKNLESSDGLFKKKDDLLGNINFTINYPMFFVEIIKEIFKDELKEPRVLSELGASSFAPSIPNSLVGSIVECHLRGLLPSYGSYEYHDESDREIDYINRPERMAVEMTIANKSAQNVHLDLIPSEHGYKKILLTRDIRTKDEEIEKIPYYEFIYGLSGGKEKGTKSKFTSAVLPDKGLIKCATEESKQIKNEKNTTEENLQSSRSTKGTLENITADIANEEEHSEHTE